MASLSEFAENLKSNRDTQITVALIIFFMLAFPLYFNFASNNASSGGALGTVGDYKVSGEYTFVELDSAIEGIADGETLTLELHSDAVQSQIADKNLVAVIVNMTYDEDETANGGLTVCRSQVASMHQIQSQQQYLVAITLHQVLDRTLGVMQLQQNGMIPQ